MSEYGITKTGLNIKRLDTIVDEIHEDLSEGWGVNTRLNPKSKLNVLVTDFADKVAELWELAKGVYDAMYPSSAEGASLDNACQFGGTVREISAPSYYPIHCTGIDGTPLDASTILASDTNPQIILVLPGASTISRSAFNGASIKVVSTATKSAYTVSIDGTLYTYTPKDADGPLEILNGLHEALDSNSDFEVLVKPGEKPGDEPLLMIEAKEPEKSYSMILTENLTTDTVTSIITFATQEKGDIVLPYRAITKIVQGHANFLRCTNLCPYVAGRLEETDRELRKSYNDKIFNRSNRMLESIRSAILTHCQGVLSVAPYENATHQWYVDGNYFDVRDVIGVPVGDIVRPPHSIEIVVDGGDPTAIAKQILENKAGGINTVGAEVLNLPGEYGEPITIRFNRPTYVYTWVQGGYHAKQDRTPASQF